MICDTSHLYIYMYIYTCSSICLKHTTPYLLKYETGQQSNNFLRFKLIQHILENEFSQNDLMVVDFTGNTALEHHCSSVTDEPKALQNLHQKSENATYFKHYVPHLNPLSVLRN